jgi:putative ABC transport system ATP-binding protein
MAQLGLAQRSREQAGTTQRSRFAVELRHVAKSYGTRQVYEDLHFQLLHGTFVAATGPIGSGKTTLINMFAGLEKPTSGSVIVEGVDITLLEGDRLAEFRTNSIGLVPQVQNLIPELSVRENVELPLLFKGTGKESRRDRLDTVLDRVGIGGDADRTVEELSVGERQLVSVARALINDPPILLLDEPTESLDPLMSEVILGIFRGDNITAGKTVFVTTHDKKVTELARKTLRIRSKIS